MEKNLRSVISVMQLIVSFLVNLSFLSWNKAPCNSGVRSQRYIMHNNREF